MSHNALDIGRVTNLSRFARVFPSLITERPCPEEPHIPRQTRTKSVALGTRDKLVNKMKPRCPRIWQSKKLENKNKHPAIPLLDIYSKELKTGNKYMSTSVGNNIIYSNQMMKTTQTFVHRWMDTQTVVYPYNKTLFSHEQKKDLNSWYTLQHGWTSKTYAKWKKPGKKLTCCMTHLYETLRADQPRGTQMGLLVAGGWEEEGVGECLPKGAGFPSGERRIFCNYRW